MFPVMWTDDHHCNALGLSRPFTTPHERSDMVNEFGSKKIDLKSLPPLFLGNELHSLLSFFYSYKERTLYIPHEERPDPINIACDWVDISVSSGIQCQETLLTNIIRYIFQPIPYQ